MLLFASLIVNVIAFMIIISLNKEYKSNGKVIYKDKIVYKEPNALKETFSKGNTKPKRTTNMSEHRTPPPKPQPKMVKEDFNDVELPSDVSPKKMEILRELGYLESKGKKTKKDLDTIYTLKMVLPNIK